jgi:inhibitor of cysteine peptidase
MAEIVVLEAQNGSTVAADVGDSLVVRLPENPTTGYRWQIDAATGLTLVADDSARASSAPGAGGERQLRFTAPAPGVFRVEASLRRAWERDTEPQARFQVVIQVR